MTSGNPIFAYLERRRPLILDGGFATELEARGRDLSDELWSAACLLEDPDLVRAVHLSYLEAGADCLVTATYQATVRGFKRRGLSTEEARALILRAVDLAREARDSFWHSAPPGRLYPLIAASIGPYGAFRADGSEYTGDYDLDEDALVDFHRERFRTLAAAGADLLACETIPSLPEARALLRLLDQTPEIWAWLTFSCRDGRHLADGSELAAAVEAVDRGERLAAIGVNCTAPRYVAEAIDEIRRTSGKLIVVYPNSGEIYDAANKCWLGDPDAGDFARATLAWVEQGAALVGGCCRTTPEHIRRIRALVDQG